MAKKPKKKKPAQRIHVLYEKKGEAMERKNKFCPKCGPGVFLGKHKDRYHCGRCNYAEFVKEIKEEKK